MLFPIEVPCTVSSLECAFCFSVTTSELVLSDYSQNSRPNKKKILTGEELRYGNHFWGFWKASGKLTSDTFLPWSWDRQSASVQKQFWTSLILCWWSCSKAEPLSLELSCRIFEIALKAVFSLKVCASVRLVWSPFPHFHAPPGSKTSPTFLCLSTSLMFCSC